MNTENNTFMTGFKWSTEVVIITSLTVALLLGTIVYLHSIQLNDTLLRDAMSVLLVLCLFVTAAYSPVRLSVDNREIVCKRMVGRVRINLADVQAVRVVSNRDISHSIRTFGSGGLFGYLGHFKNKMIGRYIMYATEMRNLVYVETGKRKYVFSCPEPHEFVRVVEGRMGG
jgi:hypothetical protein